MKVQWFNGATETPTSGQRVLVLTPEDAMVVMQFHDNAYRREVDGDEAEIGPSEFFDVYGGDDQDPEVCKWCALQDPIQWHQGRPANKQKVLVGTGEGPAVAEYQEKNDLFVFPCYDGRLYGEDTDWCPLPEKP